MTKNGHLTVAWEMLSSVVMLRAKAKEQRFMKLLSSLHGVEVELARIIAGTDSDEHKAPVVEAGESGRLRVAGSRTVVRLQRGARTPALVHSADSNKQPPPPQEDEKVQAQSRKYLSNARHLRMRGETAAAARHLLNGFEAGPGEQDTDLLWEEQLELSTSIAGLRASTFEALADKALVLEDLVEEDSDEPIQMLARSLARDIIAMRNSSQLAS